MTSSPLSFTQELNQLRQLRLERRWSYWRLSHEIEASTGARISGSLLRKWLKRETRPIETSWYPVQLFLAAQPVQEPVR